MHFLSHTFLLKSLPSVVRWRSVRVFISSTFRDMHAERDVLVQGVFPELRRRAAAHCLHMQEVELRWGVTEEESARATELCLSEVSRSQIMVGILGERYGLVPPKPVLPDLSHYSWVRDHVLSDFLFIFPRQSALNLLLTAALLLPFFCLYPYMILKRQ